MALLATAAVDAVDAELPALRRDAIEIVVVVVRPSCDGEVLAEASAASTLDASGMLSMVEGLRDALVARERDGGSREAGLDPRSLALASITDVLDEIAVDAEFSLLEHAALLEDARALVEQRLTVAREHLDASAGGE